MEFFLTLACLYAAQCFVHLDSGETLGLRWRFPPDLSKGQTRMLRGGGWRPLHPWPAAFTYSGESEVPSDRGPSETSALRDDLDRVWRRTRALRWISSLQLCLILGLGPVGAYVVGAEMTLLFLAGPAVGIHFTSFFLLYRAQRAVLPEQKGNADRLMIAALYPPALLRSGAELVRLAFKDRHITELASAIVTTPELERLIRIEIGRAKSPLFTEVAEDRAVEWLLEVAALRGLDRKDILSPRPCEDVTAASYCELCGGDYLSGHHFCSECQLTTTLYPISSTPH